MLADGEIDAETLELGEAEAEGLADLLTDPDGETDKLTEAL